MQAFNSYQIKADEKRGVFEASQGSSFEENRVEKYSIGTSSLASEKEDVVTNMTNARNRLPTYEESH